MGGFCPGGFVQGDFVQGGILSRGILSGGFCLEGFCPGGFCPRTSQALGTFGRLKTACHHQTIVYMDHRIVIPPSLQKHVYMLCTQPIKVFLG